MIAAMMAVVMSARAEESKAKVDFAYEAGAEVVSAYLWRGLYNGGFSFQPTASIGFDAKDQDIQFRVGAWASFGASDWQFRHNLPYTEDFNPNTYFIPEIDLMASIRLWGATLGVTHYYYFGGQPFFSKLEEGGSQTEVQIGYDLGNVLEDMNFYINWYTMVAGGDCYYTQDAEGNDVAHRAWSSYIEIGYTLDLPLDMSLGFQVGMTPWKSLYTDYEGKFAVNNISARFGKTWTVGDDVCDIELFALGCINTYDIRKDNLFVDAAGNNKLGAAQKLNGCIGLGFWF